jgi:hypothetical protein
VHLFLDANTYLGFYRLSDDNLEQLAKLGAKVSSGDTALYVTEQVRAEFLRNREATISDAVESLRKVKGLPNKFPRLFETIAGYDDCRRALTDAETRLGRLISAAETAIDAGTLPADRLIAELMDTGRHVAGSDEIIDAARKRIMLGNPPGKEGSIGDAVHWESLLREVPHGHDLVLVTDDRDFRSKLDGGRLNQYLDDEWTRSKGSHVHLHRTLRSALDAHYPGITLTPEPDPEQEEAVARLVDSGSYAATHNAIERLGRFAELNGDQVADLIRAGLENAQVAAIVGDKDVFDFYENLLKEYGKVIPSALWDRMTGRLDEVARTSDRA